MRWRIVLILLGCATCAPLNSAPAPKIAEPRLELRLTTSTPKVKESHRAAWTVKIVNRGKQKVKLVQPGDGSDCGWRTPIIEWVIDGKVPNAFIKVEQKGERKQGEDVKVEKPDLKPACLQCDLGIRRCGNVNSLRDTDLFELGPDKEVTLNEWVNLPFLTKGKHVVAIRYFNIPDLKWKGLARHDERAMARVKESYKATLESNAVEIEVGE